jgi:rhodanese-related sulfurtransferase
MVSPEQLDETMLFDEKTYILDIRPQFLRRTMKSLPNSHLASYFSIDKYLNMLPKNKDILVVCQNGKLSYVATCYLKSKGFERVSSLLAGITGWKEQFSELYRIYGGYNLSTF